MSRDQRDFSSNAVYHWRKPTTQPPRTQRTSSVTSLSSLSESSGMSSSSITTRSGLSLKRTRDTNFHTYRRRPYKQTFLGNGDNKVINLSKHKLTDTDLTLLSKGLSFSPKSRFDVFTAVKDLHLFARSLMFKKCFYYDHLHTLFPTEKEQIAIRTLEELAIEHNTEERVHHLYLRFVNHLLMGVGYAVAGHDGLMPQVNFCDGNLLHLVDGLFHTWRYFSIPGGRLVHVRKKLTAPRRQMNRNRDLASNIAIDNPVEIQGNCRELYRIMEFVRNMERRRLIKPQDILATLQSIPEDESESELQEHVFDSDSDEDFIPQNISSESEDSEGTNPEDIPSTSTGDRAHAVMLPRDHPPGRGQKKSAKRPRNERTTDNDGGEGNATTNTREGESEGILVSADGIQWKPVEIGEHLPGRRDSQNILREAPGPTGYARRNIIIDSPLSAWHLFFDSYILTHIKNCTLAEACRNNNLQFTLSDEELDAFIAIFYARGISGTNRHSISSIWCNDWGIPFCKATMSRDRFVEIMRFLRFDEKSTRSERLQTDKFALFSTVWDRFIDYCIACYKPGPYITVDEQLFPSKTRCPFTQYMPSKPDKYGHKYWLAVDKRSKYLANGFPYLGKDDTRRAEDRLADHVVMKLLDPFLKKGRNVTTDNYFTSVKLAKQLKSKGTTIVGTLNKIRREVPKEIKSMKEELYNTKVFRNEDNFTLTVYQGKPNKNDPLSFDPAVRAEIPNNMHHDLVFTCAEPSRDPSEPKVLAQCERPRDFSLIVGNRRCYEDQKGDGEKQRGQRHKQ
ncbi:uncharacterized protein [Phyllobates terribilis]|uniref:uncharacterized protein n=1 Tax=Phyllobates terribilis TaxID=111132 RepID=UPI003CCB1DA0